MNSAEDQAKVKIVMLSVFVAAAIILSYVFLDGGDLLTGHAIEDAFCHENPISCPDINGDGMVDYMDEEILSCLVEENYTCILTGISGYVNVLPYKQFADFNYDGDVDQVDVRQCFTPMRDEIVDKYYGYVLCNQPDIGPENAREFKRCTYPSGCG
jgi:hypothetical protein